MPPSKITPRTYEQWVRLKAGPIPCCIYDRHSSDTQDESTAENRQQACREYAAKNGMVVVDTFVDYAKSGQSTAGRTGYLAMLAEALSPSPRFVAVLVYHSFRWGRGEDSKFDFLTLRRKGRNVISVTESLFQDEGAEGSFARDVIMAAGAYQARQHGRYTHGLQQRNAMNGYLNGGRASDGYIKLPIALGIRNKRGEERYRYKLDLNPNPGPYDKTSSPRWRWVRDAADMALKRGMGLKTIAQELEVRGWRQVGSNKALGPSHVRTALTNPMYTGFMVWNRRLWSKVEGRRRSTLNTLDQWIWSNEASHPQIITREEFDHLAQRYSLFPTRTVHARRQLLAGLLECKECGSHFVISSRTKKGREYLYLICGKKQRSGWGSCKMPAVPLDDVEGAVQMMLLECLLRPEAIKAFFKDFRTWLKELSAESGPKKKQEAEIMKIEQELKRFVDAIAAGAGVSPGALVSEIKKREDRLTELRLEVAMGAGKKPEIRLAEVDPEVGAARLRAIYLAMGKDGRRAFLRHVIRKIVVMGKEEGRVFYDPARLLTLQQAFPGLAAEERLCLETGCGGWI